MKAFGSELRDKKNTITYRIFFCFLITVVALLMLVGYYAFNLRSLELDETRESFFRDGNYVQMELERAIEDMLDSARTVGYTTAVQKTLFSDNPGDKIQNITTARELVGTYRDNNDYIIDLFYYADDGHIYTQSSYYREFRALLDDAGEDTLLTLKQGFLSGYTIEERNALYSFYLLPIFRTASSISHTNDRIGVCGILCDFSPLLSGQNELISSDYTCYVLYNGRIVTSQNAVPGLGVDDIASISSEFGRRKLSGREFYSYSNRSGSWQIVLMMDADSLVLFGSGEHRELYVLIVMGCIMFISMLLFITRRFSREVNRMVADLNSLKAGTEQAKVSIPKGRELETIALEINSMIDRLEEASENSKRAQEQAYSALMAQQSAEMTAYRSQINPHFFFNTLETIRSMSQYYHADMIEEIISAMSKMFRYSLYAETVVTLEREVDMLEQFFLITSYRFPDRYELDIRLEDETKDFPVPSMILQPLVENSIKHAFSASDTRHKNRIEVAARILEDGRLYISINDNGRGITPEKLAMLIEQKTLEDKDRRTRDSIGIRNIYERIKLFDKDNNMEFSSELGAYTKVELTLHPADMAINSLRPEP